MTASYLFRPEGLAALARYVAPDTLFAFDLDGTLVPVIEEYRAVQISEQIRATLKRLIKVAKVAVITGRSRQDALAILAIEPQLLVGNHGSEWPDHEWRWDWQQVSLCLKWRERLNHLLCIAQGVEIEFKGEFVSIHYRKADDPDKTLLLINTAIELLEPSPKVIGGKFVVNLLPMEALTKGEALVAAMEKFGLKRAIFFGDDVTDEEVFQLKYVDVFGIHIGENEQTAAKYYLKKQTALLGLLNSMVGILELHHDVTAECS